MKRFILGFLALIVTSLMQGQITLQSTHMPDPGYAAYVSVGDTLAQVDATLTGPNYTWNFAGMQAIAQQRDSFVSKTATVVPNLLLFPFFTATVVRVQPVPDSVGGLALSEGLEFFKTSGSKYELLGRGGSINGIPLALVNNPKDVVYRFPLNYGDQDSSESVAELSIPGTIYIRQEQKRVNQVDGWGLLKTPYGDFNVLRMKTDLIGADSIAFDTITFSFNRPLVQEYKWLGQEEAVPLMQITAIAGITSSVRYVDSMRTFGGGTTTAPDLTSLQVRLFPNPARKQVMLKLNEKVGPEARLLIYDIQGQLLREGPFMNASGYISLQGLAPGTYIISLRSKEGVFTGRLVIR